MNIEPEHAEEITRNIERTGEFLRYLMDNPSEMEKIPNGSHIRFVDSFESLVPEEVSIKENIVNVRKVYEFA
ncbi:MAG: hypothetical protein LBB36_01150 [Fibromonadaceae bacterium]|jgi:hypothetical protein|nr:hypothetical protein [Fibromonadaceae bacterium]